MCYYIFLKQLFIKNYIDYNHMLKDYLKFSSKEMIELLYICLTLGVLFSLTFIRFASNDESFFQVFLVFFIFVSVLLSLRLLFIKYVAYKNGFEIHMKMTYF